LVIEKKKFKLEICGKAQRESVWRPKSDCRENLGGKISHVAKSHDPHSNALAYAKRALLI